MYYYQVVYRRTDIPNTLAYEYKAFNTKQEARALQKQLRLQYHIVGFKRITKKQYTRYLSKI